MDFKLVLNCPNFVAFLMLVGNFHIARSTIFIRFPDKDVSILLLHFIQKLAHISLFGTGAGNKRHLINVKKKLQAEGNDVCNVLPAYTLSQLRYKHALLLGRVKTHLLISLVSLMFSVPWKIF